MGDFCRGRACGVPGADVSGGGPARGLTSPPAVGWPPVNGGLDTGAPTFTGKAAKGRLPFPLLYKEGSMYSSGVVRNRGQATTGKQGAGLAAIPGRLTGRARVGVV